MAGAHVFANGIEITKVQRRDTLPETLLGRTKYTFTIEGKFEGRKITYQTTTTNRTLASNLARLTNGSEIYAHGILRKDGTIDLITYATIMTVGRTEDTWCV